jgi:DNA recombination protein RmuC
LTDFTNLLPLVLAFALGAVIAWLVAMATLNRRRVGEAERLSAAEAKAELEREMRQTLEEELEQTQTAVRDLDRRLAVSQERVDSSARLLEEQRGFVERARKELEDSFGALAATALKGNTEQFLSLAEQSMNAARERATADLDQRRQAIEALLSPFRQRLDKLDQKTGDIERARVDAYSRIDQQVQLLAQATAALEEKTTSLDTALRGSETKGRWGEIALRNIAELAGMSAHCDFEEQVVLPDGSRPDMIVNLPGKRKIVVDAKAPLTAFLEASEAKTVALRESALERHVRDLRSHVRALAGRNYAAAAGASVDLVVLFLPGDAFLSAAFAKEPDFQVQALRSKVLIATPTTLVALLRTVAIYWQQQAMAENAQAIAATARDLYERAAKFSEDLSTVGRGLRSALDAYNRAVGSFNHRLMPMGRRLEELKVSEQTRRDLGAPEIIDERPREPVGS